ncbi:LamG-like jellyroll fold domain-containing protein [Gimesia aquarii]|uniref:FecR protein n=1 Tax=Gimesia aquarii TaxID=2527964 RepID=A0A517W0U7_9PLAN|nr:LamG-like jellyroll fold domain-containing protein [Gimesia aquarii]QDT98884.1 FecR protein [Gimesia aquarii]
MLTPEEQEELMQLCWEYQYGDLSHKDAARLERLVLNSDQASDFFIQYAGMCANLEWEGIVDPGPLGRSTNYDPLPSGELRTLPLYLHASPKRTFGKKTLFALSAFLVVLVVSISLLYFQFWQNNTPSFLARITNTQKAVWEKGKRKWKTDELLHARDELYLSGGLIELETALGARVILKGNSHLIPINVSQFQLDQGNLFANVPPQAEGLTIDTPTSRIVDLGTKFGLIINPSQETEVHVLKGLVEFNLLNSKRETTVTKNLFERDAIRIHPDSHEITKIETIPEFFVQNLKVESPALIGHWKLTETENSPIAKDYSGNQLELQIIAENGKSPFTGKPAPNNALTSAGPFDSQSRKLFRTLSQNEARLFDMSRFTIELWARNPNSDQQADSDILFHYRNTAEHSTSQFNLYAADSLDRTGKLGFGFLNTKGKYVGHQTEKHTKWQKDRWYHIVFTYDSNTPIPNDSIVTLTRTPEFASVPDMQQTLSEIEDIHPLVAGGILVIGGSTLTDISRHWGGEISDVRFINGIPDRYLTHHSQQTNR